MRTIATIEELAGRFDARRESVGRGYTAQEDVLVRLVVAFDDEADEARHILNADAFVFSMSEKAARTLCALQRTLPKSIGSLDLVIPNWLDLHSVALAREPEGKLLALGRVEDVDLKKLTPRAEAFSSPGVFLQVTRPRLAFVCDADLDGTRCKAGATMTGEALRKVVGEGLSMNRDEVKSILNKFFPQKEEVSFEKLCKTLFMLKP